jgi:hypothetical protein
MRLICAPKPIIPGSDRFDLEKCDVKLIDTDPKADGQKLWMATGQPQVRRTERAVQPLQARYL